MKFSIVAVAMFAAILGKASPVPVDGSTGVDITAPATQEVAPDAGRTETSSSLTNVADSNSVLLVQSTDLSDHAERVGGACAAGLKVYGFARIADYTVHGYDFSGSDLAAKYKEGKFDNYGGPIIAGALARSESLPGISQAFVQSQNANYFYHKNAVVSAIISALTPDTGYATYVLGDCSQFTDDTVFAHCCQ